MADYLVTDTELTNVANAIRAKRGLTGTMAFPDGFVSSIGDVHIGWQRTEVIKTVETDRSVTKILIWKDFASQASFANWLTDSTDPLIVDRIYAPDIAPSVLMRPYYSNGTYKVSLFFYQSSNAVSSVPDGTEVHFIYRRPIIA